MSGHYHISGRVAPTRSLLGRVVCRAGTDRLRCQTRFYLLAVAIPTAFGLVALLAWAGLMVMQAPVNPPWFWAMTGAVTLGLFLVCWVGYQPSVHIEVGEAGLVITPRGQTPVTVPAELIRSAAPISAESAHQHFRRYARTRLFLGQAQTSVVLLRTVAGPILLGINPAEAAEFLSDLKRLSPNAAETRVA